MSRRLSLPTNCSTNATEKLLKGRPGHDHVVRPDLRQFLDRMVQRFGRRMASLLGRLELPQMGHEFVVPLHEVEPIAGRSAPYRCPVTALVPGPPGEFAAP